MSDTLRTQTIRLASTLPKGDPVKNALLTVLARYEGEVKFEKSLKKAYKVVTDLIVEGVNLERDMDDDEGIRIMKKVVLNNLTKAQKALDDAQGGVDRL